jgi:acyl-CoA reductase-like NAD-dependent aldehyde dehydrogenase
MLHTDLRALRAQPPAIPPARAERVELLVEALRRFRSGAESFERHMDDYGIPPTLTRRWSEMLAEHAAALRKTDGSSHDGEVVAVSLPSNTFTCLEACLDALASGAVLWIRPSRREPVSAERFVRCLLDAGWPKLGIGLYPTDRDTLGRLLDWVDRAVVYGDSHVDGLKRPHVVVRGPGRAVVTVDYGCDVERACDELTELVASNSGRFCTNVGTIILSSPNNSLVEGLARRLDTISPEEVAHWVEPARACAVGRAVLSHLREGDRLRTRRPMLETLRDRTRLLPTLVELGRSRKHPLLGLEVPFSAAVVAVLDGADAHQARAQAQFSYRVGNAR